MRRKEAGNMKISIRPQGPERPDIDDLIYGDASGHQPSTK